MNDAILKQVYAEDEDEDSSKEWEQIKNFVGGTNKQSKHPLQLEKERMDSRKIKGYDQGGGPDWKLAPDQNDPLAGLKNPLAPPVLPKLAPMPTTTQPIPKAAPTSVVPTVTPPSTAPYDAEATKALGGINPEELKSYLSSINTPTTGQKIGQGISSFSDALMQGVARAGEGHSRDNFDKTLQQNRANLSGIPEKVAELGKERFGLSQGLQELDSNSPLSKSVYKQYQPLLQRMGIDKGPISAKMIGDITGKTIEQLKNEAQEAEAKSLHEQNALYQTGMLENTREHQSAEENIAKTGQELQHYFLTGAKKLMGGNQPSGGQNYKPDVISYAQKHGITPEQALAVKNKRGGQ